MATRPLDGTEMLYLYICNDRKSSRTYRYLIIEHYDANTKRRITVFRMPVDDAIKLILRHTYTEGMVRDRSWCGGWDLNPRRPTPSGPEPDPFDLARAPPHLAV